MLIPNTLVKKANLLKHLLILGGLGTLGFGAGKMLELYNRARYNAGSREHKLDELTTAARNEWPSPNQGVGVHFNGDISL